MEEGVSSWVVSGGWVWDEESYSAESTLRRGPALGSLPGLVGVCLGEGCCIGPLPSPPGWALRGSEGQAWLSWWGQVSNPVP